MRYYQSSDATGTHLSIFITHDDPRRNGVVEIYRANSSDPSIIVFQSVSIRGLVGPLAYSFRPDSFTVLKIIDALNNANTDEVEPNDIRTLEVTKAEVYKEFLG